jgi:hypothetical protein
VIAMQCKILVKNEEFMHGIHAELGKAGRWPCEGIMPCKHANTIYQIIKMQIITHHFAPGGVPVSYVRDTNSQYG